MKTFLKIASAMLLLGSAAWAQNEQWLEYHTSNDGRSYQLLNVTNTPPPGVALPKLTSKPWFAYWKTPMDSTGGRWICLDRTRKSGPYDRLYIDSKGNNRLDDKTPISAQLDSYNAMFPAAPVVFKGEDGSITYHVVLRFYQYETNAPQVMIASGGWYEGKVDFGGVKKPIQLLDGNVNGTFNDIKPNPYDSDRVQIPGDKTETRFLGRMVEVNGNLFKVEVARDGAFIKVQPAKDVAFGQVRVPENISDISAFGENGYFVRKLTNGALSLPIGNYQLVRWTMNRKDEKNAPWTMTGYSFPESNRFDVTAAQQLTLDIGEPVRANLSMANNNKQINFSLQFVGKMGESIEILRDGQRPRGPKLMLANATGTVCYTNTFEFG